MTIHLKTLGQIDLRDNTGAELRNLLTQPKRLAVLLYLSATATDRLCRRDSLLAMFWPESDAERARAALRQAIHFIRQEAGADIVTNRGADEIGLQEGAVDHDVIRFEQLAAGGQFAEALELYTGDFLDGFFVRGAPDFERWVAGERDRLRRRASECAWSIVELRVATGDLRGARDVAERAVRLSADSEIAVRRFIELLARSGDKKSALIVYREFSAELAKEYGVQPSRETLALVESLAHSTLEPEPSRAPEASPPAAAEPTAQSPTMFRPRKRREWSLVAVIVLLMLVAGAAVFRTVSRSNPMLDANRVAVLPFMVRGSPELRYLHDGLPLLLSTRLDGVPNLNIVDMRAVLLEQSRRGSDSLSLESATETAQKFGARLYIVGNVIGSAGQLHVDASLYDGAKTGAPIARVQASGAEVELVTLVDRIATQLLADRFRRTGGVVAEMAARTTTSFPALKAWLEGESEMARGRYTPAIASFRSAIAADSSFAMAYYRLALAAAWAGDLTLIGPSAKRAVELSDRLPPNASTMIKAFLDSRTGHYGDAERAERALLAERPTSIDAWFDLGEVLYHSNPARGRSIFEAREPFEQLLRMDPNNFAAMSHLVRLAAVRGNMPVVDSLTKGALAGDPDGPHRAELLLLRFLSLHDDNARRQFLAMPHDIGLLDAFWRTAEYTENLNGAEELATALLDKSTTQELRNSIFLFLSHCALGREQFARAQGYADSLSASMPRYGAVMSSIIALHPATGKLRDSLVSRANRTIQAAELTHSIGQLYAGGPRKDQDRSDLDAAHALIAAASHDTIITIKFLALVEGADGHDFARNLVESAIARTRADTAAVLRGELALDSTYSNAYAPQHPLAPRARLQLDVAQKLTDSGRHAESLARLSTIPEDFGFNIGFLAEVHRRRAELLRLAGRTAEANEERTRAARVLQ